MNEFKALVANHPKIYKELDHLKRTVLNGNHSEVIQEIKQFNSNVEKLFNEHFALERELILPNLEGNFLTRANLADCIYKELDLAVEKNERLTKNLKMYDRNPNEIDYHNIIAVTNDISFIITQHILKEDVVLSQDGYSDITDKRKKEIARQLAEISCEVCTL